MDAGNNGSFLVRSFFPKLTEKQQLWTNKNLIFYGKHHALKRSRFSCGFLFLRGYILAAESKEFFKILHLPLVGLLDAVCGERLLNLLNLLNLFNLQWCWHYKASDALLQLIDGPQSKVLVKILWSNGVFALLGNYGLKEIL